MKYKLINGNSLDILKTIEDNTFDSIVTDPPYELCFMGKSWDSTGIAFNKELWKECLRVLKPGGHLISFSSSRTYHRMAVAIEDAGFEIRDQIMWVYGSGFPKSLDVSKAIEGKLTIGSSNTKYQKKLNGEQLERGNWGIAKLQEVQEYRDKNYDEIDEKRLGKLEPTTEQAKQWQGWGTALKPAHEPMVLARKPLSEKTVAENVLRWGVGGLNIDVSRIDYNGEKPNLGGRAKHTRGDGYGFKAQEENAVANMQGRWPANFIHDGLDTEWAKFFYYPKASKKDRNEGCEAMPLIVAGGMQGRQNGSIGSITYNNNNHPTVKPTDLMAYLCRLVTPKNGLVLDPFNGSGSTGKACAREGFDYLGLDLSQEYLDISKARIDHELNKKK